MRNKTLVILISVSLLIVSCGGTGADTTIGVVMTDFQFSPNTFTILAGEEITVEAVNNGAVVHELVIMKYGLTVGEEFGDEDEANIYWEVEVEPGASSTVVFTAPTEAGEYQLVCGTEGHLAAGMVGTLKVVSGE
jgi:uncharacterized cupredoxin-like copper-binding protein